MEQKNIITIESKYNRMQFRLNEINRKKDYFTAKIYEREIMNKTLSKHIAAFDYFDKT